VRGHGNRRPSVVLTELLLRVLRRLMLHLHLRCHRRYALLL
jgi:hypothetical protein